MFDAIDLSGGGRGDLQPEGGQVLATDPEAARCRALDKEIPPRRAVDGDRHDRGFECGGFECGGLKDRGVCGCARRLHAADTEGLT
jgi:hypothetical protein